MITAVAFCVFAAGATVGPCGKAWAVLPPRIGSTHAAVIRYSLLLIGILATLVFTLQPLKIPIGQLVLGGAITGILIGIAAQQTMANLFAAIVLLLSRPFHIGQPIRIRSGALGGVLDGTVTEIASPTCTWTPARGCWRCPTRRCSRPRWARSRPKSRPGLAGPPSPARGCSRSRPGHDRGCARDR
jgi:hypothetical protein